MKIKFVWFALAFLMLAVSCKKEEGTGGRATIKGKVHVTEYNNSGVATGRTFDGADVDVFIIYGTSSEFYDDNVKTSYDGSFEFRYLRTGVYRIFVYSRNFGAGAQEPYSEVMQTVEITDKKQVLELPVFEIKLKD